jgi:hypothetical protein
VLKRNHRCRWGLAKRKTAAGMGKRTEKRDSLRKMTGKKTRNPNCSVSMPYGVSQAGFSSRDTFRRAFPFKCWGQDGISGLWGLTGGEKTASGNSSTGTSSSVVQIEKAIGYRTWTTADRNDDPQLMLMQCDGGASSCRRGPGD